MTFQQGIRRKHSITKVCKLPAMRQLVYQYRCHIHFRHISLYPYFLFLLIVKSYCIFIIGGLLYIIQSFESECLYPRKFNMIEILHLFLRFSIYLFYLDPTPYNMICTFITHELSVTCHVEFHIYRTTAIRTYTGAFKYIFRRTFIISIYGILRLKPYVFKI